MTCGEGLEVGTGVPSRVGAHAERRRTRRGRIRFRIIIALG
jgi:hypothetical protein